MHYLAGLPQRPSPHERAAGDWDIVAAVGFDAVNAALAGLHATRVVPRDIDLEGDRAVEPTHVVDVLRELFEAIPEGISSILLRLDPAPTLAPIAGTDGAKLRLPFTLDLGGPSILGDRITLASIRGSMQLGVSLDAEVGFLGSEGRLTLRLGLPDPASPTQALTITIAADSPVQPRPGSGLQSLITVLGSIVTRRLGPSLSSWVIAPLIHLPLGTNTNLLVRQVGVRAVDNAHGGAVVVGVRVGGLLPEPGDPNQLGDPFGARTANLFVRVHEELVRNVLRAAHRSGYLDDLAHELDDSARIENVDVSFTPDAIRFHVRGRLIDGCGLWKDLPFEVIHVIEFAVEGDRIVLTRKNQVHVGTLDAVLCFLTSVLEGALVGAVAGLASGLLVGMLGGVMLGVVTGLAETLAARPVGRMAAQVIWDFLHGEGSGRPDTAMIDLDRPLPGTELLPRIEGLDAEVDEVSLRTWHRLSLVPDTLNTHVYVALVALVERGRASRRLPGVRIEMVDQDVPAPLEDDVRLLADEPERVVVSNRERRTASPTELSASHDPRLATATTDAMGLARVVLRPQPERHEPATAMYFRARLADGRSLDSRTLVPALVQANLRERRLGTPDFPLILVIPS